MHVGCTQHRARRQDQLQVGSKGQCHHTVDPQGWFCTPQHPHSTHNTAGAAGMLQGQRIRKSHWAARGRRKRTREAVK